MSEPKTLRNETSLYAVWAPNPHGTESGLHCYYQATAEEPQKGCHE